MRLSALMVLALAAAPALAAQERGNSVRLIADTAASSIEFSVRFLGLGRVWGEFHSFSGQVWYHPSDPASSEVEFLVDVGTIDTENGHRDQDLSENWFEMDRFPTASFRSDSLVAHGERWLAFGRLQIKDVSQQVVVPLTISISGGDGSPVGARVRGTFTIDRMIYGIDDEPTANSFFDASTMIVGDDVTVDLRIGLVEEDE